MRVLELYSGVGGMHWALKKSGFEAEIVAAIDINPSCNHMYRFNFSNVNLLSKCLTSLNVEFFEELEIDMVLLSPPCQPFTCLGNQLDVKDPRTNSFQHFMQILTRLKRPPKYILLENVKGFSASEMRNLFVETLVQLNYIYQEFLLCPTQFGIPNSRKRYYLLAKLKPSTFAYDNKELITELPDQEKYQYEFKDKTTDRKDGFCGDKGDEKTSNLFPLKMFLEVEKPQNYYELFKVPRRFFKKFWLMDLVEKDSRSCCCFTKGYGKYIEKSGSIFQTHPATVDLWPYKDDEENEEYVKEVEKLGLRFFTPREIANLMAFPQEMKFPTKLTTIQFYKLLGNSVNVHVISCLLKYLFKKIEN